MNKKSFPEMAKDLFGVMKKFTPEQQKAYTKFVFSQFEPTGNNLFDDYDENNKKEVK